MDTDFSIAIHMLILVSESDVPLSSIQIAESVGVNASRIRKIAGSLRAAGIIVSRQGAKGFTLASSPTSLTLLRIYDALYETTDKRLFPIHKNPNDRCIVGRFIQPTLSNVFAHVETETKDTMKNLTLADIVGDMRGRIERPLRKERS